MESLHKLKGYSTIIIVGYSFLYLLIIYSIIGLNHDFWGDEIHFYKTALHFASKPTLHTLQHYEEMNTPLPFIIYACWSKMTGPAISDLRLLSLLIAFCTFYSLFYLFKMLFPENPLFPIAAVILFSIIPYIPGLSIFFYTDLIALLFMLLAFIYCIKNKPVLFFIFSLATLMCRQYFIFFTIACTLFFIIQYFKTKNKQDIWMIIAAMAANVFLLFLFYFWKGTSPDNELKKLYTNEKINFHTDALLIYLCYFVLYTFPLLLILLGALFNNRKRIIYAFLFSFIYWIFPLQTSIVALEEGITHIGLFHKAISYLLPYQWETGLIYQFLLFLSLSFFFYIIDQYIKSVNTPSKKYILLSGLNLITFLIIMPFSYLTWEKYVLPAIPFVYILYFETLNVQKFSYKISNQLQNKVASH